MSLGEKMFIGKQHPAEWNTFTDTETGRTVKQLTAGEFNNYPLYYFIPSVTQENDALVFHSERGGWVQLYKLDLKDGQITQLTDGHTRDSGWAIWCEHYLRGIYNHLSALNTIKREVYYFQDDEVRCTHIDTLDNRVVAKMAGRMPIGQSGFSPDGRYFVFIHADHDVFTRAIQDREAIVNMRQRLDHMAWRHGVPTTISIIDTQTGDMKNVIELDYHVHHVFFLDNEWLLINHLKDQSGMWTIRIDGTGERALRPGKAGEGQVCHQVITEQGIFYESNIIIKEHIDGYKEREVWYGHYDRKTDAYRQVHLPGVDYVHTGMDPKGRFLFVENLEVKGNHHQLLSVHFPNNPDKYERRLIRNLKPTPRGQRFHAHPFLDPKREWLYYTEFNGEYSQVCAVDVRDLVDLNEYWGA